MLVPRASSAFVCIRCELRLARPRVPPSFRRPPHANFSVSSPPRDALDALDALHKASQEESKSSNPREPISKRPLERLKRGNGKAALIEHKEQLTGVKTLGQDAAILVLREVGRTPQRTDFVPDEEIINDGQDPPRVLASLEAQAKQVSPEEIQEQLELLRPKTHENPDEPHYVGQTTFIKLSNKLNKSFTASQLSRYYSSAKGIATKSVKQDLLARLNVGDDAIDRTPWNPGQTSISRRLPGYQEAQGPKRKPVRKPLLVDRILRDVWRLVLLEEIEAPGEIELNLKPWQLYLLNAGEAQMTTLDRVGARRKAKIEIYWPHNVLRITADKNSAEYAADDIEEVLKEVETSKLNLKLWTPFLPTAIQADKLSNLLSRVDLQLASTVSRTHVQVDSHHKLLIRGLDKPSVADAERALLSMLPITPSILRTVDTQLLNANHKDAHLVPNRFKSSIDYCFRKYPWARWTNAVGRSDVSSPPLLGHAAGIADPTEDNSEPSDVKQAHANTAEALKTHVRAHDSSAPFDSVSSNSKWKLHPDLKIAAEFGSVLFPPRSSASDAANEATPSAFSVPVPGVSKMLTATDMRRSGPLGLPVLEYEFLPDPSNGSGGSIAQVEAYPRLKMRFKTQNKAELSSVGITFGERVHDVLIPDGAADLRFKTSQRLRLRDPLADANVKQFADEVCANIDSGDRLTAPDRLEIEIPRWVLPGFPRSDPETVKVVYMFTQVNYRQDIVSDFRDISFKFSTLQGNRIKGKRSQISTYYHYRNVALRSLVLDKETQFRALEAQRKRNESQLDSFVRTSFEVAARLTRAASSSTSIMGEAAVWSELRRQNNSEVIQEPMPKHTGGGDDQTGLAADWNSRKIDSVTIPKLHSVPLDPADKDIDMVVFIDNQTQSEGKTDVTTDHVEDTYMEVMDDVKIETAPPVDEESQYSQSHI